MTKLRRMGLFIFFIVALIFLAGCVKRIVTINSQPSGAEVFFDRKAMGVTPCSFDFTFYGSHSIKLAKEGYKDFYTSERLKPPFYEYLPLDFISEVLLPAQLEDTHNFTYRLIPEQLIER
jgi:hypothetical protein